jgi:hypothetical protein
VDEVRYLHQIHTLDKQLDQVKLTENYYLKIFGKLLDHTKVEEEELDDDGSGSMENKNVRNEHIYVYVQFDVV